MNNPVRKSRLRKISRIILYCMLVGIFVFAVWRIHLASQVSARLDALRAAGLPTNPQELDRWQPAVPDHQNAALVYTQAFAMLAWDDKVVELCENGLRTNARNAALSPDLRAGLDRIVATNQDVFPLLDTAATLTNSRYPNLSANVMEGELAHLAPIKNLSRLLKYRAILAADSRDAETATRSIHASLKVGNSLRNESLLISFLVKVAAEAVAASTLEQVLARVDLTDAQLASLQASFADAEDPEDLARALIGERAFAGQAFNMTDKDIQRLSTNSTSGRQSSIIPGTSRMVHFSGFFQRDYRFYLDAMQTAITYARRPAPLSLELTPRLEEMSSKARQNMFVFSGMVLPALANSAEKAAAETATLRNAQLALAVERYRQAHSGTLPEDLAALAPRFIAAIPADPFTGAPIRYQKRPRGYVVYSVGQDRTDEGGKPPGKKRGNTQDPSDIVLVVER